MAAKADLNMALKQYAQCREVLRNHLQAEKEYYRGLIWSTNHEGPQPMTDGAIRLGFGARL
ncbi:hypothetical protein MesoLj113a_65630 [Mesorhizobium sp. 113-1-2]|nr:hypothetical protein MLTONO_5968 [Mesorhizobium loti]BCG75405.1 hypothetical protein MesoLj113a_65630 [Mesorhizobium sp. 113-1-2]